MAKSKWNDRVNTLFHQERWNEARALLQEDLEKAPDNHWLLTQVGVTYYEQKQYKKALQLFLTSREIVADCPLTLWNLAGTLDALGKHSRAVAIYTWILESKKSPKDDPCWESSKWTEALKADAVYRLGVCFEHMAKKRKAEQCYRQYLNLLLAGIEGAYALEDVSRRIRAVHGAGKNGVNGGEVQKAVAATLEALAVMPKNAT